MSKPIANRTGSIEAEPTRAQVPDAETQEQLVPPTPPSSLETTTGRTLRSAAFLCSVVMAALVYLLLALPGAHRTNCSFDLHDAVETAHLPRGTSGFDTVNQVLPPQAVTAAIDAAPPGARGPALVALVAALVIAILAFFPVAVTRLCHATVEAVLGVGRWHRTVVLHL